MRRSMGALVAACSSSVTTRASPAPARPAPLDHVGHSRARSTASCKPRAAFSTANHTRHHPVVGPAQQHAIAARGKVPRPARARCDASARELAIRPCAARKRRAIRSPPPWPTIASSTPPRNQSLGSAARPSRSRPELSWRQHSLRELVDVGAHAGFVTVPAITIFWISLVPS